MGYLYRVKRIEADNLIVEAADQNALTVQEKEMKQKHEQPTFWGRRIGLMYWNYVPEAGEFDGYSFMGFYPTVYDCGNDIFLELSETEDLRGSTPLDRFVWETDEEPKRKENLRRIILEQ